MQEDYIVKRIEELCEKRSWTYYRLSKESGIPYSTLSTMLHKTNIPSVPSLEKICKGFGITLAQFFSQDETPPQIPKEEYELLKLWNSLDDQGKALAKAYIKGLSDMSK